MRATQPGIKIKKSVTILCLTLACDLDLQDQGQIHEILLRPTQHFLHHPSISFRSRDIVT